MLNENFIVKSIEEAKGEGLPVGTAVMLVKNSEDEWVVYGDVGPMKLKAKDVENQDAISRHLEQLRIQRQQAEYENKLRQLEYQHMLQNQQALLQERFPHGHAQGLGLIDALGLGAASGALGSVFGR